MRKLVDRSGPPSVVLASVLLSVFLVTPSADARMKHGPITISGNIETQNILRAPAIDEWAFVQQRNTLRLEYEHNLMRPGEKFLELFEVPFVRNARLFTYYRFVYDSIYDIAPGPFLEANDGSRRGSLKNIPDDVRSDFAFENRIREMYVDFDLADLPVSFRIGKQQIVWGNANLNQRALDTINALDLTWHFQVEAGLSGRVGFSELRRTAWTAKMIWNVGNVGPISNVFFEAYEIPFDFKTTKVRFGDAPWSAPFRDPFRGGQAIPAELVPGLPAQNLEPCFDFTGNTESNSEAGVSFDPGAGTCNTPGLQASRSEQGIFDRRDPRDVNQVGARIGGMFPGSVQATLVYIYRRALLDNSGTAAAKRPGARTFADATGAFLQYGALSPHTAVDPATGEERNFVGYIRIPTEFYQPYVHIFGWSFDFFEQWFTQAVWNFEQAWIHGSPISSLNLVDGNGIRRTDHVLGAVSIDRPTWIPFLNRSRVFDVQAQLNYGWFPFHEDLEFDEEGEPIQGFVGSPVTAAIPGQFGDATRIDKLREIELLSAVAVNTSYWGGSLIPVVVWVQDWTNFPAHRWSFILQYLPSPWIILESQLNIWWTNGELVDDLFRQSVFRRNDELVLKATYQF